MRVIDADAISVKNDIECVREVVEIILDEAPTLNAIIIPENATNGDMIMTMFPDANYETFYQEVLVHIAGISGTLMMRVNRDWWNAPYKRG